MDFSPFNTAQAHVLLIVLVSLAGSLPAAGPPRYLARTVQGELLQGDRLTGWEAAESGPSLEGRRILNGEFRVRWLMDRLAPLPAIPERYVEFHGGDRLPGEVRSFHSVGDGPYELSPPHYLVHSTAVQGTPAANEANIRVTARFVKRLVWQRRRRDRYEPSHVFLRDGRGLRFRSFRADTDRIRVLLDDGQRVFRFREIAELHLPARGAWDSYVDAAAILCSDGSTRCHQIETIGGLRTTASRERMRAVATRGQPERSIHGVQPAWSLDLFWVLNSRIRTHRFWQPHEVPLTWFDPSVSDEDVLWPWRRNRTVHDLPFSSRQGGFGWGFGVQGRSELRFDLPAGSVGFRSGAALDRAGIPGEVQTTVQVSPSSLADTQTISTTKSVVQHHLRWPAESSDLPRQLRLRSAASPLDIAKSFHWGDPQLLIDPARLKHDTERRALTLVAPWIGWRLISPLDALERRNIFIEGPTAPGRYFWCVSAKERAVVLRREAVLPQDARWLIVDVSQCFPADQPVKIEVRADARLLSEESLSAIAGTHLAAREPIAVPLDDVAHDRAVQLEIRQVAGVRSDVFWHSIVLAAHHPSVYQIFEDEPEHSVELADSYHGDRCLSLEGDQPIRFEWSNPIAIREHPLPGQYRYLRFAIRAIELGALKLEFGRAGGAQSVAYIAGESTSEGLVKQVVSDEPPDRWVVVTRDLFGDFGEGELLDLTILAEHGAYLWDHCQLARTPAWDP